MFGSSLSKVERLIEKKKDDDLAKLAAGKDSATQLAAIAGLGKVRGEISFNTLVSLLRSPDANVRVSVANAILIVTNAEKLRVEYNNDVVRAATVSASVRLRPILMTSLATSMGALPIALSLGASATSRMPLGIVIVGGLLFSLLLTLFVIPAIYTFISGKHKKHEMEEEGSRV